MRSYGLLFLVVTLGSVALPAAVGAESGLRLRLVPVAQGVSDEPDVIDAGQAAGVDVRQPTHPLLIHAYAGRRLFYVFYKTVDEATGPKQYLLQRIRKTERFYASPDDRNPRVQESYLVEAFKLQDGTLKRPDQHFGSFGLGDCYRREVVKEYEIGYGELEGVATGDEWPFRRRFLYHAIHNYDPDRSLYDQVKFTQSKRWTLQVSFDQGGSYSVRCPELGFDAPRALPLASPAMASAPPMETSPAGGAVSARRQ